MKNELSIELTSKFEDLSSAIEKVTSQISGLSNKVNDVFREINKSTGTKNFSKNLSEISSKSKSTSSIISSSFSVVKTSVQEALSMLEKSIDYSENLNLFNVAMDKLSDKGMKFQRTMNEAFGTNMGETLRYQGLFQAMSTSMGIANEDAYKLSEGLTKIGMDLSSLYNISDKSAWAKLRAGLAGQTEPLRTVGMDITENSLKPLIEKLNITDSEGVLKSVRQLNYAEKMLLRYLAIVDQAKVAQGDFANTIEAPANQLKILSMQSIEAGRALGNLFVGAFGKMLPYANAVIMVIKEVANVIAGVLGIEISDYNSSISELEVSFSDMEDNTGAIGDGLGKANSNAKKLKETLTAMSFDELHNINTPTPSSSSGGSGGGASGGIGSIDPKLLNALGAYENGMEKVRMKAAEIRDNIMEWLGFTKKINPLTGETYWQYEGISKTLSNIWKSFKNLSTEGKILVGLGLGIGALKLWNTGKKLLTVFGGSGLGKALISLISPTTSLIKEIGVLSLAYGNLWSGVKVATQNWRIEQGIIDSTTGKVNGFSGALKIATNSLIGIGTSAVGFITLSKSVQSITEDGTNAINVLGTLGGSLSSIAGLTMAGASAFGVYGAIGGATIGVIGALISALNGYASARTSTQIALEKETKSLSKYVDELRAEYKAIDENANLELTHTTYSAQLVSELESLVDTNGKVKQGYEERATFILENLKKAYGVEYEIVDGQIQKYGEYIGSIKEAIETKKAEILLNASQQKYAKAIEEETTLWVKKEKAQKKANEAQKEYDEKMGDFINKWGWYEEAIKNGNAVTVEQSLSYGMAKKSLDGYKKTLDESNESLKKANSTYEESHRIITNYESLETAVITENKEAQKKAIEEWTNSYKDGSETRMLTSDKELAKAKEDADVFIKNEKKKGTEITEEMKQQAYNRYNILVEELIKQTSEVEKITPEQKKAWKTLAETDYQTYSESLSKISPETRKQIQKATGVVVETTPEVEKAFKKLSTKGVEALDQDMMSRKKGLNTIKSYLYGLSDSEQRELLKGCGVKNVDKVMEGLKKGDLSADVGIQILKGLNNGLKNGYWQGQALNTAYGFANNVLNKFKKTFGIASPSKILYGYGINLDRGLIKGINHEERKTISSVGKFSDSVVSAFNSPLENINTELKFSDYKPIEIDKTVNYGKILGDFQNSTSVSLDNKFIDILAYKIGGVINDRPIDVNVDIKARTDKSTIVETAIEGINEYKDRTGECPIKVI